MTKNPIRPLIGVPACVRELDSMPFHVVGDKYVRAVSVAAGGEPLIFPALGNLVDPDDLLDHLDGVMLTGSPSNVHPEHYGQAANPKAEPHDPWRDETTLPMIRRAIERGVPLLAICRGFQELNVALGGTLHARLHEIEGRLDHRRVQDDSLDVQYGPQHELTLVEGGRFREIFGKPKIEVNSLHWQGIDRLADALAVEATAPDGTIEGVRVETSPGFALGVQWHPEYKVTENPESMALFSAFGEAARRHGEERRARAALMA